MIILGYLDHILELWPDHVSYIVENYFNDVINSLSIPVSIIPDYQYGSTLTTLLAYGNYIDFHYIAEQGNS